MSWWSVLKQAAISWSGHKDARLGAALAYYTGGRVRGATDPHRNT